MIFKILLLGSVMTICSGEPPTYPQEKHPKHAISSQSFVREDVPLSYKYSAVHVYTVKPKQEAGHKPYMNKFSNADLNPVNYAEIQYAPLPLKRDEHTSGKGGALYTRLSYPLQEYKTTEAPQKEAQLTKEHLEPRPEKPVYHNSYNNAFVPGYNIHAPQIMYVNQGKNAFHKGFTYTVPEEQSKANIINPIVVYAQHEQQMKKMYRPKAPAIIFSTENPKAFAVPGNYNGYNIKLYNQADNSHEQAMRQFVKAAQAPMPLYPKVPRIHLNTARGLGIAHTSRQALNPIKPINAHANPGETPPHAQTYIKHPHAMIHPLKNEPTNNITNLYPV